MTESMPVTRGSAAPAPFGSFRERFRFLASHEDPSDPRLLELDRRMKDFYCRSAVAQGYFEQAEAGNTDWLAGGHVHQRAVLDRVQKGDLVVEFSCGNGYASRPFHALGARYLGFDLSPVAMGVTKKTYPHADLVAGDGYSAPMATGSADVVVSFFAIEHIVWPHRFLEEMVRVAKPGGLVALAFPDYLANPKRSIGSIRLGRSGDRIRAKAQQGRIWDALQSTIELKLIYPRYAARLRRQVYDERKTRFFVNLAPTCLVWRYQSDNDAIHFASEEEIANHLDRKGCEIIARSRDLRNAKGESLDAAKSGNGFVLARKRS